MKCFFLVLLTLSLPAQARWQKLEEASVVIEHLNVDYDVRKDGSSTVTSDYTVRIQSEDAKASQSVFKLDYNAMNEEVQVLEAYTLNGKKKIPVEKSAIEDREAGESRDYDAVRIRSLVFPQVQIGSRLHIKYQLINKKPVLPGRWSTGVSISPGIFMEKMRWRIRSELPIYAEYKDPRGFVKIKHITKNSIEITNQKRIPGGVHAEKDPFFHPANETEFWISTSRDWVEFFKDFSTGYEGILSQPLPLALKPWLKAAAKKKSETEKIVFLLEKMSQEFRYFGDWRRHGGDLIPRDLAEIEKSRYGDCKDLSTLLVAMLRALKMEAHVALVRRGENPWIREPDYKLPVVNRFNHAIVRVKSGDKVFWLDPTNPVGSLTPYADIRGRPSYVLTASGGVMDRLPETRPEDFENLLNYEIKFNSDATAIVRLDIQLKKLAAYDFADSLMRSPRSEVLSQALEDYSDGELISHKYLKEPQAGRSLKDMNMAIEYVASGVTYSAGKASFVTLGDSILQGSFYETEGRESDLELNEFPFRLRAVRRLRNMRLVQAPPAPCAVESEWVTLKRRIASEGRDVLVYQDVDLRRPYITQKEFQSKPFKQLQQAAKNCFYRQGILVEPVKGTLSSPAG